MRPGLRAGRRGRLLVGLVMAMAVLGPSPAADAEEHRRKATVTPSVVLEPSCDWTDLPYAVGVRVSGLPEGRDVGIIIVNGGVRGSMDASPGAFDGGGGVAATRLASDQPLDPETTVVVYLDDDHDDRRGAGEPSWSETLTGRCERVP